jgi:hypothetical protein
MRRSGCLSARRTFKIQVYPGVYGMLRKNGKVLLTRLSLSQ